MKTFQVCYYCGDGIYSTNMIEGTTNDAMGEAIRHCRKFGYTVVSFKELADCEVAECKAKGMPLTRVTNNA